MAEESKKSGWGKILRNALICVVVLGIFVRINPNDQHPYTIAATNVATNNVFGFELFPLSRLFQGMTTTTTSTTVVTTPNGNVKIEPNPAPPPASPLPSPNSKGGVLREGVNLGEADAFLAAEETWNIGGKAVRVRPLMMRDPSGQAFPAMTELSKDQESAQKELNKKIGATHAWVRVSRPFRGGQKYFYGAEVVAH